MSEFTHLDDHGHASMVDVSDKKVSKRYARATTSLIFPPEVLDKLKADNMQTHKGSVMQTAILAGIMAAKKTADLIPLCHPLKLDHCEIDIALSGSEMIISCSAAISGKTGVEMEALVGSTVAALTVYDMCKSLSHDIIIRETRLIQKTGGKNDFKRE